MKMRLAPLAIVLPVLGMPMALSPSPGHSGSPRAGIAPLAPACATKLVDGTALPAPQIRSTSGVASPQVTPLAAPARAPARSTTAPAQSCARHLRPGQAQLLDLNWSLGP